MNKHVAGRQVISDGYVDWTNVLTGRGWARTLEANVLHGKGEFDQVLGAFEVPGPEPLTPLWNGLTRVTENCIPVF